MSLIASEDIYIPRKPYGRMLIARKGFQIPKRYAHLLDADGKAKTRELNPDVPAPAQINPPGTYDQLSQKRLAELVKDRGLDTDSTRKADLIDALEAADEAGEGAVVTSKDASGAE